MSLVSIIQFTLLHLLCVAVLCFAAATSLQATEAKKPLTQAEIPVAPNEMPDYILQQLKKDPFVKEHFGWKLAFCQHPMYLLIDEDRGEPTVGERIPPWGAANAEDYVERVRRNLQSLENLPELKLNYQWSAVELRKMVQDFPDVYARLKKLYKKRSLDFLDGTYSQAHLQVLGSESNWRQFEYGLEVYRELFEKEVDVYARQETGLHLQLPQLLKQFGYRFAALPDFHAVLEFVDGSFKIIKKHDGYKPAAGDEFVDAVGLDGSTIPTYLLAGVDWEDDLQRDLYSGPKICYSFPDLSEIDREDFEEYRSLFDWVLLRDALVERWRASPARAKARLFSYWSYIEGVWAEELLRKMKSAEEMAVLSEQMSCMAKLAGRQVGRADDIRQIWQTILKSQHHDISWIEVTDLRRKSINRLDDSIKACTKMMTEVGRKLVDKDDNSMAVFNGLPRKRRCLVRLEGNKSLEKGKFQEFKGKSIGFVDAPPGGYKSFEVVQTPALSKKTALPEKLKTSHYSIKFSEDGLIEQIKTRNGKQLLSCGEYLGGEIRARIAKQWVDNRKAKCTYYSGKVADILERTTSLGEIPVLERYYFFRDEPAIKVQIEFDFNGNEVGYFWIDKTKINIYYPTRGTDVYHDIPFGYVAADQNKPLFATNWLYCGGLVYVNQGTIKHWVKDGVVANVVAWGGNHFSNRLHWDWLESPQYDIRLYGKQKIEYFLLPCGKFNGSTIVQKVADLISSVFVCAGKGEKSFYQVKDKHLAATSVYEKDGQVWMRGYKLPSKKRSKYSDWEIFNTPVEKTRTGWFFGIWVSGRL
ncbi:MAG: glycoside hydrolase family 38 N-terminal domain-containing protein [Planctomycetota bacterium]